MKKTKFISAFTACLTAATLSSSGAVVIAGWDNWSSGANPTATTTAVNVAATAAGSNFSPGEGGGNAGRGSSIDTTWGTFDGNGTAADSSISQQDDNMLAANGVATASLSFTITNNTTLNLDFSQFHMDVAAFRPNAPRSYDLNILSGDMTVGNVFSSTDDEITHFGGNLPSGNDYHDDIDLDLTMLADHRLAPGESAVIQIAFSSGTGSGGGHHLFLDNVAFSGDFSPIPEPSSIALLGFGGLALLRRRR